MFRAARLLPKKRLRPSCNLIETVVYYDSG